MWHALSFWVGIQSHAVELCGVIAGSWCGQADSIASTTGFLHWRRRTSCVAPSLAVRLQLLSHTHWPTRMEVQCEIAQINHVDGLPCPHYGPDTDISWCFRCGYFALPVVTFHSQEGATATVHKTNTSCRQGAPGRLGGTRIVRQATNNEHVEQAWCGWMGRRQIPRTKLHRCQIVATPHVYIYIYINICIYMCIHIHEDTHIYIYMYNRYMFVFMEIYGIVYINIYMYVYIYINLYLYICKYIYVYIYIHMYMSVYICIYIYWYIYMYKYMYLYVYT